MHSLCWLGPGPEWRIVGLWHLEQIKCFYLSRGLVRSYHSPRIKACAFARTDTHILYRMCMCVCVSACSTAVLTLVQLEAFLDDVVKSTVCRCFPLLHNRNGAFLWNRLLFAPAYSCLPSLENIPLRSVYQLYLLKNSLSLFVISWRYCVY